MVWYAIIFFWHKCSCSISSPSLLCAPVTVPVYCEEVGLLWGFVSHPFFLFFIFQFCGWSLKMEAQWGVFLLLARPLKRDFDSLQYVHIYCTVTLIDGEPNMKSIYIYVKWKIFVMQKLHQAHSIVYSFVIFLDCISYFLGFVNVFVFSCLGIICCVLVALSRNCELQQPVYSSELLYAATIPYTD